MRSKIGWNLCLTVVFAIGGALRSGADTYDYRVQYLESSGTQYIDTGIVPTQDTTFIGTYEYVAFGQNGKANYDMIAGLQGGATAQRYYPVSLNGTLASTKLSEERYVFSSENPAQSYGTVSRHSIIFNDNAHRVIVDGNQVAAFTATLGTETKTCFLFAASDKNGAPAYPSASRIYECSFVTNDVLARKFIPVIDESGVACMFDEVEEKLYYNLGTGTFTPGPVWTPEDETKVETPWYLVEYLESTGTQWINTGIPATSNTQTRLGYQFSTETQPSLAIIGGVAGSSNAYRYYPVSVDGTSALKERYVYSSEQFVATYPTLQQHDVIFNDAKKKVYVDANYMGTLSKSLSQNTTPMHVFARAYNGNAEYKPKVRIWYYDIDENDIPVRAFIPAVDTNGVPCFHDRVSGTNFYNKGTGTFKVGRIISPEVPLDLSDRTDLTSGLKVLPFEIRPSYGTVFTLDSATAANYDVEVRADGAYLVAKGTGGDAARVIEVTGDTAIQLTTNAMPTCASIVFSGTVRLTADCDWTGLGTIILPDGVIINLNGHNLTVKGFAALPSTGAIITDTASSGGELRLRVATNEVCSIHDGVSLIGKLKLVKEGAGTLAFMSSGHSYSGGTEIRGGIMRLACYSPSYYPNILGADTSTVRIGQNCTLDINGNIGQKFNYVLEGGTLASSQAAGDGGNRQVGTDFTLTSDSVVSNKSFGLIGPNWEPVRVHLNGHTLHSVLDSGNKFFICNTTFKDEGTVRVDHGWFRTISNKSTINVGSNLTVEIPYTFTGGLQLDAPFVVSNFIAHSSFTSGKATLTVLDTYTPAEDGTNSFPNILLADGATLDLSQLDGGPFGIASTDSGHHTLSFATNATIHVALGDRCAPAGGRIVAWTPEQCPDNLDTLTFRIADENSRYSILKREDGLYLMSGFLFFIL